MRRHGTILAAGVLAGAALAGALESGTAGAARSGHPGQEPRVPVIVFLTSPREGMAAGIRLGVDTARRDGATGIRPYRLVNAFAARMPATAARDLAASPGVRKVVPDGVITGPNAAPSGFESPGAPVLGPGRPAAAPLRMPPGACMSGRLPSLEPEGLQLTHTDSGDPAAPTARTLGYTGTGVKVAFIADGLDPRNGNFLRDGRSVITDYQDFSGDGTNAPTGGGEAFMDASAVAGQGRSYDVRGFGDRAPEHPCRIRIEGTAPGADLVALKVFGRQNETTTSDFLQAIDYAVKTGHVKVLSESFGANPFPDVTSLDAVKEFNDAATARGVTVVVSSGDAGPFNTIGSPSSDPRVVSAGASTAFRFYAQTDYSGADTFATAGWDSDNVSALSSSGFTQDGRTIDMLAPGDLGWASCTPDAAKYPECANFAGRPSSIEESGGTSEAAPEIAAAAALVIGAYRRVHHGVTPPPAVVKRILTSSASDLGAPAREQGAGLLDSYRAVKLAAAGGGAVLLSAGQLNYTGAAGTSHAWRVRVANPGPTARTLSLSGRTYGAAAPVGRGSVTLSDTASPHFVNWAGVPSNYGTVSFRVPAGAGRLDAAIAWPVTRSSAASMNGRVRLDLIGPDGKLAADSLPQGVGGYGSAQALHPAAGTWKAVIFSDERSAKGTTGKVLFGADVSRREPFGSVSPRSLRLAPGTTGTFTVTARTPSGGGDRDGAVVLRSASGPSGDGGGTSTLPVTVRGLIPVRVSGQDSGTGRFGGVLTGGNGRFPGEGQIETYQFAVPAGRKSLDADITLRGDAATMVTSYLVAPGGQVMGYGTNYLTTGWGASGEPVQSPLRRLSVYAASPVAGRWTLIVDFTSPVPGNELADPFSGVIRFDSARAARGGLPVSAATVLTRGRSYRYPVTITNTGAAPEDVFLDARLDTLATYALRSLSSGGPVRVPMPAGHGGPQWLVPAMTRSVTVRATSSTPVTFDFSPSNGSPDIAAGTGTAVSASFPAGRLATPVTPGVWLASPSQAGPYGPGGAKPTLASMSMTATARAFDDAVTSGPGDFWRFAPAKRPGGASFTLLRAQPGQSRVITATIRPSAPAGAVVRGTLYVDDFADSAQFVSGSQLVALPYEYRVG